MASATAPDHEDRQQPRLSHGHERKADASGDERPPDLDARTRQDVERDVTEATEPRGGEQIERRGVAGESAGDQRGETCDWQAAGE